MNILGRIITFEWQIAVPAKAISKNMFFLCFRAIYKVE